LFLATVLTATCGAGCTTARGLADEGRLTEACAAVSEAPSPLFDDDARALASRIRARLPGSVTVRRLDPRVSRLAEPGLGIAQRLQHCLQGGTLLVIVDDDRLQSRGLWEFFHREAEYQACSPAPRSSIVHPIDAVIRRCSGGDLHP
jgi:hypothetical protein